MAQKKKLELICRKLMLSPKDKVLDIGCDWGGFAQFAAERYQCHVTGITISDNQMEYAKKSAPDFPLQLSSLTIEIIKARTTRYSCAA
mgnify:CR=1 FL=1